MRNMHEEIRSNQRNSMIVLFSFFIFSALIFAAATYLIAGGMANFEPEATIQLFYQFYPIAILLIVGYLIYFLSNGDKMILKTTQAKEVSRANYPHLFHAVEGLSIAAGISPAPKCYVIEDSALNAYATGFKPEKSHIVVTTGLMQKLNRQELEGVVAHELAHIKNQDIKYMLYIAGLLGVFTLLGTVFYYMWLTGGSRRDDGKARMIAFGLWLLFAVLAPFFTLLFKLAMSRKREYLADASGALFTRYPAGLAGALQKIKGDPDPLVDHANKATAHLFISNPFKRKKRVGFFANLFSTHPPIDERIERLKNM